MLDEVCGPFRFEEILKSAGAFEQNQRSGFSCAQDAKSEFQVLARLVEGQTFQELSALRARSHDQVLHYLTRQRLCRRFRGNGAQRARARSHR